MGDQRTTEVRARDSQCSLALRPALGPRCPEQSEGHTGHGSVPEGLAAQQAAWQPATNDFGAGYQPSFTDHIYPILSRAIAAADVHSDPKDTFHDTMLDWSRMSDSSDPQFRKEVFKWIRDPTSSTLSYKQMPRGLGDDYTTLDDFESGLTTTLPKPTAFLSLTPVQFALLKAWANGSFKSDWTFGAVTYAPIPASGATATPHGLDRAALENCVGGPFYPGIEVSWLIRELSLYTEAFRLRDPNVPFLLGPLTFHAGFFSQQMALPWQADFYDCHKEEHDGDEDERMLFMWWTAQRPDDVRLGTDAELTRWVAPFDTTLSAGVTDPDDLANFARFENMRTRWSELPFIVLVNDTYIAQE